MDNNKELSELVDYKLSTLSELKRYFSYSGDMILYGAGRVCLALVQYLARQKYDLERISCILVSDKAGNPDNIMGIPVCPVNDICLAGTEKICIATFENAQAQIYRTLELKTHGEIKAVTSDLFEELLESNQYRNATTEKIGLMCWYLTVKIFGFVSKIKSIEDRLLGFRG